MDELIRTLAVLGRPFPPELREIYLQMEKDYRKRRRGWRTCNAQHGRHRRRAVAAARNSRSKNSKAAYCGGP